ncbi:hypothetical protein [Arthrobacter sp. YN]|uniref:hypothetical protein n=1 Tax=Arthrobacter sp. YN TaxID=2020486 RepID=UPI000B5F0911|nr:hypothetical protein [Arthrobacter sp. YN]ASN19866.1 hypothetical protein CGK93_09415 [Arthrobacter sp. YN]
MMDPQTFLELPTDTSFMVLATSAAASAELVQFTVLQEEHRPAAIWLLNGLRTAIESRGSTP